MSQFIVHNFPIITLTASIFALVYPPIFIWFQGIYITIGLGIIMLGMGITLSMDDYRRVMQRPFLTILGFLLQFTIMPLTGFFVAEIFELKPSLKAGIILVACCPGGTASNVITFLAKGDVALSVTMTAVSTMAAVILTPFLSTLLIGNTVKVDTLGLFVNVIQVIVIPLALGALLNRYWKELAQKLIPLAPATAVILIVMIVASVMGSSRDTMLNSGPSLFSAVFMLHLTGFGAGYILSLLLKVPRQAARTISIEVGMQNSGLGVVLARNNFIDPLTAMPSAISSLVHSLIGSFLAALWRRQKK